MHVIQTRPEDDGDPVEVSLGHAGRAEAGRDATAEHVGQTAAAALVQQDEQRQQEARETEQDLQDDLENLHGEPFRARRRVSVPTIEYSRTRGGALGASLQAPTCFLNRTMLENSSMSRLAPPTSAPSTFGSRRNAAMFAAFTDPP